MIKRFAPVLPALVLVGLMALPAFAGPRGGGGFRFLRHLDLTGAQKTQVREVAETYRTEMRTRMNDLRSARQALRDIVHGEAFDEAAVRQAHKNVSAQGEELAVLRAKAFADIRPILTPEQLETLKELPARKSGRGMGGGKGRGHGRGMGDGPACDDFDSDML